MAFPPASSSTTAVRASASHTAPSVAWPAASTSLTSRASSWSATRADALPQAAGSRSRGKTKSVLRMASCLTSVRSAYSAASTSSTVTPSTRAHTER